MKDAQDGKAAADPRRLSPGQLQRLYRRHLQGAVVRTAAIAAIWTMLLGGYLLGAIRPPAFAGVTASGLLVILANVPFLWGLKRITRRRVFEYYNLTINIIEAVGDTAIIYFLGGIKGMYLAIVYAALIAYVGVAAPRRYPFIIATICSAAFAAMAAMEHWGVLPHQNNTWGYPYGTAEVVMVVFSLAATLYVLSFIVSYTAGILKQTQAELQRRNRELEASQAAVRSASEKLRERNAILEDSLQRLKETQEQLVESEKMAALGGLVAGVAHEINTPVGIGITAASFLLEKIREGADQWGGDADSDAEVNAYFARLQEAAQSILANLGRAGELIRSFKQVAVDQSSEARRWFNMKEYIEGVLLSLRYQYKRTGHEISLKCPDDLAVNSYPGLFYQVVTNLLMNSLIHGLEDTEQGRIEIEVSAAVDHVRFVYRDNGKGMEQATADRIFEPFFTTKKAQGGSGLGLNIVYNIVTRTLGGRIKCRTTPGEGVEFDIMLPEQKNIFETATQAEGTKDARINLENA